MKSCAPPPPSNGFPLKLLAVPQLLLAVGGYFFFREPWPAVSTTIALMLAIVFFSRERIHDERVEQLKLRAISYGVGFGLLVLAIVNLLGQILKGSAPAFVLSGFDTLILVLLIAFGLFHYWRWQDGREGEGEKPNTVNH